MAFDALRHREYSYAEPGEPFEESAFVDAIEREDLNAAESMVARGLEDGLRWKDMESAFVAGALLHFNDFGHSLIYTFKTSQLVEVVDDDAEKRLCLAIARHLCYTTREDLLPEFRSYGELLDTLPAEFGRRTVPKIDPRELFPVSTKQAHLWIQDTAYSYSALDIYWALLEAVARNLLHYDSSFDAAYDRPVNKNVGWLHFSHGFTFANAARNLCGRHPQLWQQGLMQVACMLGRNRHFLDLELDESDWKVDDVERFFDEVDEKILDHGFREPIFSAHVIKTSVAVREEMESAPRSCREYLVASLNRLLNANFKQKHTRRFARQANELVSRDFE